MKEKFRNIFWFFGIFAIVVMLCTFDMDYQELWQNLRKAGVWFPAVILLWVFIYYLNAWSWYVIIRDGKHAKVPFWKVYKLTVSGFALNYATPVGLMGGEPYRIMELTPYVGASKATSSVILYVMMHIFSHFWFWLVSVVLFVIFEPVNWGMGIMLSVVAFFCLLAIYFFMKGYRNGMAVRTFKLLCRLPYVKRWASRFLTEKRETLERVDAQIAALHKQRKSTFYVVLGLEFMARIVNCAEVFFILNILTDHVSFLSCILIMAFTSLFANLFFFSPMQLGAREGGFALAVYKLTVSGFALNYATPVGLMGGEPYRIMELTPYVGASKATSSVILYVMMHIFSHFWFWLVSVVLFVIFEPVNWGMGIMLSVVAFFCLLAIYFFMKGYRNGMAVRTFKLLCRLPYVKRWASRFLTEKRETLERVDAQIAALHKQRKSTFYVVLGLEFMARIVNCAEVFFILNILTDHVSFLSCILIMAFTSLFANLFFFSPMQLGAREGGFALAVGGLAIPSAFGIYTGLITRVRELIWIVIGVLLMKVGNGTPNKTKDE